MRRAALGGGAWLLLAAGCVTGPQVPGQALRHAAATGDLAGVKAQVAAGAPMEAREQYGKTPLAYAALGGHAAVADFLLASGADIDGALADCEESARWGAENGNSTVLANGRRCLAFLGARRERAAEARRAEERARLEAARTAEMAQVVQAALAAAQPSKQPGRAAPAASDIDAPVFAESQRVIGEDDLAVIIGIEGYQSLPKSDYSYDDAKLVKEYARALGFKERNIELLLDERATRSALEKTLEVWLKNKAKPNGRVLVYYSGHGAPDPATGKAFLVPYDGDPNYLGVTGYPVARLYEDLGRLPAAETMVVLDACFSGAGGRSVLAKGARPLVTVVAPPSLPPNAAVLAATQGTEIGASSPEKGHGVFTYQFLKALKEGAATLPEIYARIKPLVEDQAKEMNIVQSPTLTLGAAEGPRRFALRR